VREQNIGIEQINRAIGQMDQVTQQDAALVEQVAAASASLRGQAAELAQAVSVFRLEEDRAEQRPRSTSDHAWPLTAAPQPVI
jgi:uncharacterized phage infection (PIP) family protein YhgE